MAKYALTYDCGHNGEVQIVGPTKDRAYKLARMSERDCPACAAAKRTAARATENATAAQANAGLPALEGSEKQVAWAETIRAKALAEAGNQVPAQRMSFPHALIALGGRHGVSESDLAARSLAVHDAMQAARRHLETCSSAKWWIDNREVLKAHVGFAGREASAREMADLIAAEKAEKDAAAQAEAAAAKAKRDAEQAARDAERVEAVGKAKTFRVGDRPGSVVLSGGNLTILSRDGRTARGYVDGGEWVVYQIGEHALASSHPEMDRIAREARAVHAAQG